MGSSQLAHSMGVVEIPHSYLEGFYVALVSLPQDRLATLLRRADLAQWKNGDFAAFLKGGPPAMLALPEDSYDIRHLALGDSALPPLAVPAALARAAVPPGKLIGDGVEIFFDNWSQRSGEHRAYVHCDIEAHGPRTYRQLSLFPTPNRCFSFLIAWLQAAEVLPSQEDHRQFVPRGAHVCQLEAWVFPDKHPQKRSENTSASLRAEGFSGNAVGPPGLLHSHHDKR